jgi:uncharacterized damage-inducible protein DinB
MAENRRALMRHYQEMRDGLLSAIAGLDDQMMTEPSLDGWSVKDHLAHLAFWDGIRTSEVTRISAGHASAWRTAGDQDETFNTLIHDLRQGLSLEQVKWELASSRKRLIKAISSATERGLDAPLYGEAALRSTHEAMHTGWIRRWRAQRGV